MFSDMILLNEGNIDSFGDLAGKIIAYGEDSSGYIARMQEDSTVNGLPISFLFENYDWIYIVNES